MKTNSTLLIIYLVSLVGSLPAAPLPTRDPLVRTVDLNVGESSQVLLSDGTRAEVKVVSLKEERDQVCFAVRRAEVMVEVNGKPTKLVSATYHLPVKAGGVQIDCTITKGYNSNGTPSSWSLEKDVRLRLWPAKSPWIKPGTFIYPVKQKWFASYTQMANVPVYVDGGERPGKRSIYYHSGLDIGGSEGLVKVVAATDALVLSAGKSVLDGYGSETPVRPRYDVVYLLDSRGWFYRYSHLKEIDSQIVPGRIIKMGSPVGLLGKEGGSGGWSHLHFEIKSKQPSGKYGTQEGYAFLWEAYQRQHQPALIAVARPHHLIWAGDSVTLDARKSWSKAGKIASYQWQFDDGTHATGARVQRTYQQAGVYSEVLKITTADGQVDYDFAVVQVIDRQQPDQLPPSVHPNYWPTTGIRVGMPVTFKVRTFRTTDGEEEWSFGDGNPPVKVRSDGNAVKLDPDGYAITKHKFQKPGHYIVRVERTSKAGLRGVGHLHIHVKP